MLLTLGANVNIQNNNLDTPLIYAGKIFFLIYFFGKLLPPCENMNVHDFIIDLINLGF